MTINPEVARARARRSYELGRARVAVPWAILVAAIGVLGTLLTGAGALGLLLSLLAALSAAGCACVGGNLGRGLWPGVWVGSAAMVLALVALFCEGRGHTGFFQSRLPCLLAGTIIGSSSVYYTRRGASSTEKMTTLLAVFAIATPLALIVCAGLGLGGIIGLGAGLALGCAPVLVKSLSAV